MDTTQVHEARAWCRRMLPRVSRTFALNIRILSGDLHDAVLLSYLLCRIADSVEDAADARLLDKTGCLLEFAALVARPEDGPQRIEAVRRWQHRHFAQVSSQAPEWQLCRRTDIVFTAWSSLPRRLRPAIRTCVMDMSRGMADVTARMRLGRREALQIESLQDLETYCSIVAGTVGSMLCELFLLHVDRLPHEQTCRLRSLAERFGLALQLVNILQDVQVDRRRRVSYLPRRLLSAYGVDSDSLFAPGNGAIRAVVLARLVALALASCDAALEFSLLLPRRQVRLRLFCLWPLFLAVRTLTQVIEAARHDNAPDRPRLGRRQVRRCLLRASLRVLSNHMLRAHYDSERRRAQEALQAMLRQSGVKGDTTQATSSEVLAGAAWE